MAAAVNTTALLGSEQPERASRRVQQQQQQPAAAPARGHDEPHTRSDSHLQKLQLRHYERLREARKARANNRLRINGRFAKASLSGGV
jgi:hypothetical protein